ncbi:M23 family metallopeptidase [bacterium]|nr:MAG: M23 family metallopeptidase [bacterium]
MKKTIFLFLILFLFFVAVGIYFLDKDPFLCPIEYAKDILIRSDAYGEGLFAASRRGNRLHNGIDLLAEIGSPVLASRSGIVIAVTNSPGMGNYVILCHTRNITTIYGHLNAIYVVKGGFVRQGQVIASVGKTGNANARGILPHLHFEVRKSGIPQDPLEYLP